MSIGENIRRHRKALGMTLEEVSSQIGISRQTLCRYETGKIPNIPPDKVSALAKVLRTTPTELMGWVGELLEHEKQEMESGRTAAKESMRRAFGEDCWCHDTCVCKDGDKLSILFYRAMERRTALAFSALVSEAENLDQDGMEALYGAVHAWLHADPHIREIVDTALKPYLPEEND